MQGGWQDLRLALRTLRSTPLVTSAVIVSLALAIGANTTIFSLMVSLLFRPLPVKEPSRLVLLANAAGDRSTWSYPVWDGMRPNHPFETAAAWSRSRFNLAPGGETRFVDGLWASGSFFDTLGVQAIVGRAFSDADDRPAGGPDGRVAVIGYGFWQRHFAGASHVIGQTLPIDGVPFTIVGVMPQGFFGMEVGRTFDVAAPLETGRGSRGARFSWLTIVGRLKPGHRPEAAAAAVQVLRPRILDAMTATGVPASFGEWYLRSDFALVPAATGSSVLRRQYERPLLIMMVIVAIVMLIACANVANLLLARVAARRHEFAVLIALGATRLRLARRVLAECVMLAAASTAAGVALASWSGPALVRQLARQPDLQGTTAFLDLSADWRVLAFTIGAAITTVLLFGMAPALRAAAVAPGVMLSGTRHGLGDGHNRWSSALVAGQLALAVVLVAAALMFGRTWEGLASRPLGFQADRLLLVAVSASRSQVARDRRVQTFERALDAVRTLPGVSGAAVSLLTPVGGGALQNQIEVPGGARLADGDRGALVNHVSPEWFRTMATPLVSGRSFTSADRSGSAPVAIVNETFARKFLNGAIPLGYTIRGLPVDGGAVSIVGVSGDGVYRSLRDPVLPTVYLPFAQSKEAAAFGIMSLSIRASGETPPALAGSVTAALRAVDPDLEWTFRPMDDQIDASITQERLTAILSGSFGLLALLLAGVGLYGVTAYSVSRRRAEIGIRIALGASLAGVVGLVVSRVALVVGLGVAAGATATVWLSRFVGALLYGVEPADPVSVGGAVLLLVTIAVTAAAIPARRAARLDPWRALNGS